MRRILLLSLVLTGIAVANPLCLPDTMANYEANFSTFATACQVGDKLFYAFNYSGTANNATAPTASQVTVNGDSSNPSEPGLIFASSGWTVSALSSSSFATFIDSNIHFTVSTIGLTPLIIDGSLDFTGQFLVGGLGQAQIGETITPQGHPGIGISVDSNSGPFFNSTNFPAVSTVTVSKDLVVRIPRTLNAGVPSSASISSFREGFSELGVPEPATVLFLGSGLVGLGLLRRRR